MRSRFRIAVLVLLSSAVMPASSAETGLQPVVGGWHELYYDTQREAIVLVNGLPVDGSRFVELWHWSDEGWTRIAGKGPTARGFAAAAFDESRGVLVLHGGLTEEPRADFDETWEWDGKSWTLRDASGPGIREGPGMVYDARRRHVVLFGGAQNGVMKGDTWTWNGTAWARAATDGPSPRFPGGLAFDRSRSRVVLFGGHSVDARGFRTLGDTWTWDGSAWSEIATAGPSPRDGTRAAFDAKRDGIVLFGGYQTVKEQPYPRDTWLWNGTAWSELRAAGPPGRVHHTLQYDPGRQRIILFGGFDAPSSKARVDVWTLGDDAWECASGCP